MNRPQCVPNNQLEALLRSRSHFTTGPWAYEDVIRDYRGTWETESNIRRRVQEKLKEMYGYGSEYRNTYPDVKKDERNAVGQTTEFYLSNIGNIDHEWEVDFDSYNVPSPG